MSATVVLLVLRLVLPLQTSTASSGWQCSPPDLNRQLRTAVFPAGPQPRAPDGSLPRGPQPRAPAGSVSHAGPQLRRSRPTGPPLRGSCGSVPPPDLHRESEDMPDKAPERMSEDMQKICQIEDRPESLSEDMPDRMQE